MKTENKVNHTPGPWIVMIQKKKAYVQGRNDSAFFSIACVEGPNNPTTDAVDQKVANIKLIAACPEMLAALKYAAGLIEIARQYFPASIQNADAFRLENTCATIGKAIDKAEGGGK